uniref:Uncharacterized protein n=1 Tax=Sulfolobus neozealandicus TaxID=299422 RepID=Q5DVD8_9CREN|nr:hypothetical protein [Sulfolobus neozealandicus]
MTLEEEKQEKMTPRQRVLSLISRLDAYYQRLEERKRRIMINLLIVKDEDEAGEQIRNFSEIKKSITILKFSINGLALALRKIEEGEMAIALRIIDSVRENLKTILPEFAFELENIKKEMMREDEIEKTLETILLELDEENEASD